MLLKINVKGSIHHSNRDDSILQVTGIVQVKNEKDWSFPIHSHDDILDMVLVTRGKGTLLFNNQKYVTQKGDILVFNQDVLHGEYTDPKDPIETLVINFNGVQIEGMPFNHLLPNNALPIIKTGEQFQLFYYLFDFVKNECVKQEEGFEILCKDTAKTILSLVQQLYIRNIKHTAEDEIGFPVILEIINYLNMNYNQNIKLDDLEKEFHFSQYYLSHKFKEETGQTINQYITNRRMGEAEKLLIYTDMTVTQIAKNVGYDNLSHFYTIFKKHTGVSPSKLKDTYNQPTKK